MNNIKTKKLLKENNKFEKNLSKESTKVLTDIVVYLRGSAISEYHQEEVRRDISQMIFDGEKRNESVRDIIGEDYKSFCDEIVKSFPPRSKKERILELLSMFFQMLTTLSLLWLFSSLIVVFTGNENIYKLPLTLGQIINGIFISIGSIAIVTFVSKTSFNKPIEVRKDKKLKSFFIYLIVFLLFWGYFQLLRYFSKTVLLYLPLYIGVIVAIVTYVLAKILANLE